MLPRIRSGEKLFPTKGGPIGTGGSLRGRRSRDIGPITLPNKRTPSRTRHPVHCSDIGIHPKAALTALRRNHGFNDLDIF